MLSVIDVPSAKDKCQIFTPDSIVVKILDYLEYSKDLFGKSVIDHSCGNGQFLKEVVRRYIHDCIEQSLSSEQIRLGLSRDIWGVEIDSNHHKDCINSLDNIAAGFGVENVDWKIFNFDSLRNPLDWQFDYVIGNPPYLSYWDIPKSEREFLRNKYDSCKYGAYDYCFAFIEEGISLLKENGVLSYIVPSSIFRTTTGKTIREKMRPMLKTIFDYKTIKIFDDVLTSSAIISLCRAKSDEEFSYHNVGANRGHKVNKSTLGDIWIFDSTHVIKTEKKYRFGDFFKVSTSVATQLNSAFVVIDWAEDDIWLRGPNGEKVEIAAAKKAASPKGKIADIKEHVIFPYYYENDRLQRFNEEQYRITFPYAYAHLEMFKVKLLARDADKKAQWFEYGRSQALQHLAQPKILLSSIFTNYVHAFKLNETEIPYSGLYIVPTGCLSIDEGVEILESTGFREYIECIGVNVNGSSIRITAKNISGYKW